MHATNPEIRTRDGVPIVLGGTYTRAGWPVRVAAIEDGYKLTLTGLVAGTSRGQWAWPEDLESAPAPPEVSEGE